MRIAQITLNLYGNYGNTLQKYALHRTLKTFADSVEVLWQHTTKPFMPYELEFNRFSEGNLREAVFTSVRQNKLKEFDNANICTRFNVPYLEDIADDYDFFVVGSDQVWNPEFFVPGRFLDFAPPEKRIAYAASIAETKLPPEFIDIYRKKISAIPHVSIREQEGVDLVEKLTGKRPLLVPDPVFLLTADEWREIAKPPLWLRKKTYANGYLLTYFFGGIPPQVQTFADKLGLPTINLFDKSNFDHYITGIEEFLYLVDHATLFCTNSFHGTSFALIFKRPFITYKSHRNVIERFSRINSLLELAGLNERATDIDLKFKAGDPLTIDFTRCEKVLPIEREKAFKFLATALGGYA